MAVGWDYMAESKGAAEGARIANARNANSITAQKQANYQRQLKEKQKKDEERAAAAQEATIKQAEALDRNTFYKPQGISSNTGLNTVFDYSTQQIVDTYTSIKNDKDMDPAEQALQMRKITNQIPLIKNAKALLDKNMQQFAALSQSGEISSSMDPKFQYVYSEMLANRFDGGIDFEGDELVFKGTMPDGEEIRLPLSDFALNLPGVDQKGGTLDDSIIGYTDSLQNEIAEYRKTGKKKPESLFQTINGERVLTATGRAKQTAIENLIEGENKSGNELYAYGMDTLNMSREDIDNRVNELVDTPQTVSILSPARLKSMYTDKGLPIPSNFEPNTDVKMTIADARIQVMEEMVNQELNVLQDVYDTVEHQIQGPKIQQTPLFIQQADVKYNSIMNGASIEQEDIDTTLFTNNGYPNVEKFEEKGDKLYITIGGGTQGNEKDNNFKEIPSKQVVVDLSDPRDLQKYMTNKGYDGIGQGEDIKGRDKSIMTSQKLADYYRKKELERRKEEASETGKEKNQFQKYFPENSFSGEVNEDGLPTE